jgi:hypothetical protein
VSDADRSGRLPKRAPLEQESRFRAAPCRSNNERCKHVWKRQFRDKETYLVSELTTHDAEGELHSPMDNVSSSCPPADHNLVKKCDEDKVFALFRDDANATHILGGIIAGLPKNEIKLAYGLDERQYAAAMRRLRVKLIARADREDNNGLQQK